MKTLVKLFLCAMVLVGGIFLTSCSKDEKAEIESVSVTHKFNVSEDLLNFAFVHATFTDASGKMTTELISRPNWQHQFLVEEFPTTVEMLYEFTEDTDPKDDYEPGVTYSAMVVGSFAVTGKYTNSSTGDIYKKDFYFNSKQKDIYGFIRNIVPIKFRAVIDRNSKGDVTVSYTEIE